MKVNDTDDHVAMPSRTLAARLTLWIVLESPLQIFVCQLNFGQNVN